MTTTEKLSGGENAPTIKPKKKVMATAEAQVEPFPFDRSKIVEMVVDWFTSRDITYRKLVQQFRAVPKTEIEFIISIYPKDFATAGLVDVALCVQERYGVAKRSTDINVLLGNRELLARVRSITPLSIGYERYEK